MTVNLLQDMENSWLFFTLHCKISNYPGKIKNISYSEILQRKLFGPSHIVRLILLLPGHGLIPSKPMDSCPGCYLYFPKYIKINSKLFFKIKSILIASKTITLRNSDLNETFINSNVATVFWFLMLLSLY